MLSFHFYNMNVILASYFKFMYLCLVLTVLSVGNSAYNNFLKYSGRRAGLQCCNYYKLYLFALKKIEGKKVYSSTSPEKHYCI